MALTSESGPSVGQAAAIHVTLHEWQRLGPDLTEGSMLVDKSFGGDLHHQRLAAQLAQAGVVTITELRTGLHIKASSFIGRLVVGPLDITIVPKISWERWLCIFGFALGIDTLKHSSHAATALAPTSLQDLLILEFVRHARELIARGLHREYVPKSATLPVLRGRIEFGRIARAGGLREASMPCRYTERSEDSPLNRALLAGLRHAARRAGDPRLRNNVRALAAELKVYVREVPLSDTLLRAARWAMDRRTERYHPTLQLIEALHSGMSTTLEEHPELPRLKLPGFALDMNRLWQRLLGRILKEWSDGIEVREEYGLKGLFSYDQTSPRRRVAPVPRPDYAVFRNKRLVAYLDAKYRDLWSVGLPREMLYQVALYAAAQQQGAAAMLYPTDAAGAVEERLELYDPVDGGVRARVALRPVHLAKLHDLIGAPRSAVRERAREQFTASLIGA